MISAEDAAAEIKKMINDDPTISGGTYVIVYARKKGFGPWKKEEIYLSGHVKSEKDRQKVEEIAQHSAGGRPIVNQVEISGS
jgi:hypothetical protein